MHDPRVGRFFRVDPLTSSYTWYTPYQFAGNKVINSIDWDGLEELNVIEQGGYLIELFSDGNNDLVGLKIFSETGVDLIHNENFDIKELASNVKKSSFILMGTLNAMASNNLMGFFRMNPEEIEGTLEEKRLFAIGQLVGDFVSLGQVIEEVHIGIGLISEGSIASIASLGILSEVGIPTAVVGVIATVHGVSVGYIALSHIPEDIKAIDKLNFKEHSKNKRKSNKNKHEKTRPGGDPVKGRYGKTRNDKRGAKNQKFIPRANPNKKNNIRELIQIK